MSKKEERQPTPDEICRTEETNRRLEEALAKRKQQQGK